jgi:tetratricopeptide (TPR) repeat protein
MAVVLYPVKPLKLLMLECERHACLTQMQGDLDLALVNRSIAVSRTLLTRVGPADRRHARFLSSLAIDLESRYQCTGDQKDLDEVIDAARKALHASGPGDPSRQCRLAGMLCTMLRARIENGGRGAGVLSALRAIRQALPTLPPERLSSLSDLAALGNSLCDAVQVSADDTELLNESLELARTALQCVPASDPERVSHLANLAGLLYTKAGADGNAAAITESVGLRREVVQATVADQPELVDRLTVLGHALLAQYRLTSDLTALQEACAAYRQALKSGDGGGPPRIMQLACLSDALRVLHGRQGDDITLRDAVTLARQAVAAAPSDHPLRPLAFNQLGVALFALFEADFRLMVLDEAIASCRQAVDSSSAANPDYLANLCMTLTRRHSVTGDARAAQEAVTVGTDAARRSRGLSRSWAHSAQSEALMSLYSGTGNLGTLDKALKAAQDALAATHSGDPDRALYIFRLGHIFHVRFGAHGNPADLDQAITLLRQSITQTPPGAPAIAPYTYELGSALMNRAVTEDDDDALDEAIRVLHELAATARPEDPALPACLSDLSGALWQLWNRAGDAAALDEGIRAARRAIEMAPITTKIRLYAHLNLSMLQWASFQATGKAADLDEAVASAEIACRMIPKDQAYHVLSLCNCGEMLIARFQASGNPADRSAAIDVLRRATSAGPGEVRTSIDAGRILGDQAALAGNWHQATEALASAVQMLPKLTPRHFRRHHQQKLLTRFPRLPNDAAAAALQIDRPDLAVELLEQGRGILLTQALELRGGVTELRARSPKLAEQLDRLRKEFADRSSPLAVSGPPNKVAMPDRLLNESWDSLLTEIRQLPGLERFLMPPSASEIADVSTEGPVVLLNESQYRCDAVLLAPEGVRILPLPGVSPDATAEKLRIFNEAIEIGSDEYASSNQRDRAETSVSQTLAWIWEAIGEPVLDALGLRKLPSPNLPPPRLWWMPTGSLSFLPLHAAGRYPRPGDTGAITAGNTMFDYVSCSYTPTLRALIQARRTSPRKENEQFLIVAVPEGGIKAACAVYGPKPRLLHAISQVRRYSLATRRQERM